MFVHTWTTFAKLHEKLVNVIVFQESPRKLEKKFYF